MKEFQIVTVEREHGSGGGEIGKMLSDYIGVPCYGREILEILARRYSIPIGELKKLESSATSSLLYSVYIMTQNQIGNVSMLPSGNDFFMAEQEIIRTLADCGPAVFVGRGASVALRDRSDVLNVFISADRETRVKNLMKKKDCSVSAAEREITDIDHRRGNFFMANTGKHWRASNNYHIVLDSGKLKSKECVEILASIAGKAEDDRFRF